MLKSLELRADKLTAGAAPVTSASGGDNSLTAAAFAKTTRVHPYLVNGGGVVATRVMHLGEENFNNNREMAANTAIIVDSEQHENTNKNQLLVMPPTVVTPLSTAESTVMDSTNPSDGIEGANLFESTATTAPEDDDEFSKDQPDSDNIKMFVGQIPKSLDEIQLKKMFEQFGRVHTINVLRDKITGISKGCCFVTYFTRKAALRAQDALHNVKTLNGMHHPIQMKPADSENRSERKLFVGMLNKKYNESDVRQLFSGHGTIEECTVLRDQNGQSKGCAFVTFSTKQSAIGAIKALHQSQTMEGCSAPLCVKFADTQKEKEQKKVQQMQVNLWGLPPTNITNGISAMSTPPTIPVVSPAAVAVAPTQLTPSVTTIPTSQAMIATNPPPQTSPYLATDAISPATQLQIFHQLQNVGLQQPFIHQGLTAQPDQLSTLGLLAQFSVQNLETLGLMSPHHHHAHHAAISAPPATMQQLPMQLTNTAPTATLWAEGLTPGYHHPHHHPATHQTITPLANGAFATTPITASASTMAAILAGIAGRQIEGPEGSNLFIYHLPQEFTDTDLASTFLPFGNVLSAKVFIDKQTSLSKCFGFVSYDNAHSAHAAIQAMHGFQIGTKRLKVQLKRSKDAAKPY